MSHRILAERGQGDDAPMTVVVREAARNAGSAGSGLDDEAGLADAGVALVLDLDGVPAGGQRRAARLRRHLRVVECDDQARLAGSERGVQQAALLDLAAGPPDLDENDGRLGDRAFG